MKRHLLLASLLLAFSSPLMALDQPTADRAEALHKQADALHKDGKMAEGWKLMKQAADMGSVEARLHIGVKNVGDIIEERKAGKKYNTQEEIDFRQRTKTAYAYLQEAKAAGSKKADGWLGMFYIFGLSKEGRYIGYSEDGMRKANAHFEQAVKNGDDWAQEYVDYTREQLAKIDAAAREEARRERAEAAEKKRREDTFQERCDKGDYASMDESEKNSCIYIEAIQDGNF